MKDRIRNECINKKLEVIPMRIKCARTIKMVWTRATENVIFA